MLSNLSQKDSCCFRLFSTLRFPDEDAAGGAGEAGGPLVDILNASMLRTLIESCTYLVRVCSQNQAIWRQRHKMTLIATGALLNGQLLERFQRWFPDVHHATSAFLGIGYPSILNGSYPNLLPVAQLSCATI
jgi:hypothetical protein